MNEKTRYLWKLVTVLAVNLMLLAAVLLAEAEAARLGDSGERVALIQHELEKRKFFNGAVNGVFDIETRKGISSFQSLSGFEKSGEADYRTLSALGLDSRYSDCFSLQTELLARCVQLSGCLTFPEMLAKGAEILEKTGGASTLGDYITRNYPDFLKKSREPSDEAYNAALQVIKGAAFD